MKKVYVFLFLIVFTSQVFAQSDTIKKTIIPKQVTTSFTKTHPNAKLVHWEIVDEIYIVSYQENSKKGWTTYDNTAKILEKRWQISESELPFSVLSYVKKNNASNLPEYYKMTNEKNIASYSVRSPNKELFFDSVGKHVKTVEKIR